MIRKVIACACLVAGCHGSSTSNGTVAPGPAPAAGSAGSARAPEELVPDPITRPLSEDEARSEASRLARRAFEGKGEIKDAGGHRVATPAFPPASFTGGLKDNRWVFSIDPPAGAWAHVSFGKFAEQPQADAGFAVE